MDIPHHSNLDRSTLLHIHHNLVQLQSHKMIEATDISTSYDVLTNICSCKSNVMHWIESSGIQMGDLIGILFDMIFIWNVDDRAQTQLNPVFRLFQPS